MKNLNIDWFCVSPYDLEYKQLILLSYLKEINDSFKERKLYPFLTDIISHIKNLESWEKKRELFKGNLKSIDFEKMTLIYDTPENSKEIKIIDEIVDYAIHEFNIQFKYGRKIFQQIEKSLKWNIVGLIPFYKNEGYIFIHKDPEIKVYRYDIKRIIQSNENFLAINFKHIQDENINLKNYEDLKLSLIKRYSELPNPLTLSVESPSYIPLEECLLPIIKRLSIIKIEKL